MASVADRPQVTAAEAVAMAAERFGIEGTARELPSERDRNFAIAAGQPARRYVLKVADAADRDWLLCQNAALQRLADAGGFEDAVPRVLPDRNGARLTEVTAGGRPLVLRLLRHVAGVPLASFRPHRGALLRDLGRLLGRVDAALRDFDAAALHRGFHWDLRGAGACFARVTEVCAPGPRRDLLRRCAEVHAAAAPALAALPSAAIHGDANDHNVLVHCAAPDAIPALGLIDFGDMVHSYAVGEVAIAAAYAMLDKADPLPAAAAVLAGYHEVAPLTAPEVDVVDALIRARLSMSAVIGAEQQRRAPDNEYLRISQRPVWRLLEHLDTVHPRWARGAYREACGFDIDPAATRLAAWLGRRPAPARVLPAALAAATPAVLDLSVTSPELAAAGPPVETSVDALTAVVDGVMRRAATPVGIGRYDEVRRLYSDDRYGVPTDGGAASRTVHLGLDLFAPAGTAIVAPLDGTVHSLRCNDAALDYGPTVILEHHADDQPFFTLYGHLSADTLDGLREGQGIAAGEEFARIGAPPGNGGWPPHVHLQVIADLLGQRGDFPGVAAPAARDRWLALCPNPGPLLGLGEDASRAPRAAAVDDLVARRRRRLGPSLSTAYRRPLHVVRGVGAQLIDADGQAHLDCVNNVCHVGHCHPHVVRAAAAQIALLNTNTRYVHDHILRYAERLTGYLPAPLEVCFFVCTGSEANELALRLARTHTGRRDVIALAGGYHGHTQTLIDVSSYKHAGPGGAGAPDWVHVAPTPDPYRGRHRGAGPDVAAAYADAVGAILANGVQPAAFLSEPLLGCGGQIVPPAGYLPQVYWAVRAAGGVCIADEVQVGFGRVGSHFWGFESQGVVPDIVTLGKPIGDGHPLAAVVTTRAIAESFANGMEYFNTFGGNPVSCAIGLAVLDVIEAEGLQANAAAVGAHLQSGLRALAAVHPVIGDVRGLGLFLGVELSVDRDSRAPAPAHAAYVVERMRERGILLSTDGPDHNVIKIKPPLVFRIADADHLLAELAVVLAETPLQSS